MKARQWAPMSITVEENAMVEGGGPNIPAVSDDLMVPGGSAATRRPFAWLPLMAVSLCMVVQTVALSSLTTYVGIYVQDVLDLPSLDMSGKREGGKVLPDNSMSVRTVSSSSSAIDSTLLALVPGMPL